MKKIVALLLTGIIMTAAMVSCGIGGSKKLRGTYNEVGAFATGSITFSSDTEMTISVLGVKCPGTYEINGDEITLHYSVLGVSNDITQSYSKDGDSIFIGGTEYVKN